jgi:elongator complex protein 3
MRAIRENFNPHLQTRNRLISLALSGHNTDKVEIIIKGGTFSFYSQKYRQKFVKEVFDAANSDILKIIKTGKESFSKSKSLTEAQKLNEKAKTRIVGINIETRPDFINPKEIKFLRKLGVTHVELGVQILDDEILNKINRQQTISQVTQATFLLKESGFKVTYHLMPNLPFSSPEKDLKTFKKVFTPPFSPDHLKIYPTVIPKESKLKQLIKNKIYQPYSLKKLVSLLVKFKTEIIPPWVRISRLARDVSEKSILAPKIPSNLREIVLEEIKKLGKKCQCIRCREIKDKPWKGNPKLRILNYFASEGKEYFLEFVDSNNHCLGFLRLRISAYILNPKIKPPFSVLRDAALIRELHVYGPVTSLGQKDLLFTQHRNLGKKLVTKAEKITKKLKIKKIAVISGVGVREYYRKLGYKLQETYMVKKLK